MPSVEARDFAAEGIASPSARPDRLSIGDLSHSYGDLQNDQGP